MIDEDRFRLTEYCEYLVPRIDLVKLWPEIMRKDIFKFDDYNIQNWKNKLTEPETVRDVILKTRTRGPRAYRNFLIALRKSGHAHLADILDGVVEDEKANECAQQAKSTDNFYQNLQNSDEPLQIKLKKATEFLDCPEYDNILRYSMRSKPRGLVLIIANINYRFANERPRESALNDLKNLQQLFEEMGFSVIPHCDLTGEEILNTIKEFSQHKDLRKVDSSFVFISSHGNQHGDKDTEILGIDYHPLYRPESYKKVLCSEILEYFTSETCPHLARKPKVFMYQLCRGDKRQRAVPQPRHSTDTLATVMDAVDSLEITDTMADNHHTNTIRSYADMLIIFATLPGHVAYRDTITGSWFIQIFCEVFMNFACTTHLLDLLTIIDSRLELVRTTNDECQTVVCELIGFNKHCYLNPGLF